MMIIGVLLVIAGFIGLAFNRNKQAETHRGSLPREPISRARDRRPLLVGPDSKAEERP
jgi:hypothetical protein